MMLFAAKAVRITFTVNDMFRGGDDHDILFGDHGADDLYGDAGNDTLNGGDGVDQLYGGSGMDVFIIDQSWKTGVDHIHDFDAMHDKLDLRELISGDDEDHIDMLLRLNGLGNDTEVQVKDSDGAFKTVVTLENFETSVSAAEFMASNMVVHGDSSQTHSHML